MNSANSLHPVFSCLKQTPVIGPWITNAITPPRETPKGICDLIYATGQTISSAVKGTAMLGFNTTKAIVSLSLGIGSGMVRIAEKTTIAAGIIFALFIAYDSYFAVTGQVPPFTISNPCTVDCSSTLAKIVLNLWKLVGDCPQASEQIKDHCTTLQNAQALLIPIGIGASAIASYTLRLFGKGLDSLNKRLYPDT